MASSVLDRMRAIDRAWNARAWGAYADILSEDLVAYSSGEVAPHGKRAHVDGAIRFCETYPDSRVNVDPYMELFASPDGQRTCSIARLAGSAISDGLSWNFDVTFSVICRWQDLKIIEQRSYVDTELMLRQLRGESERPSSKGM